MDLAEFVSDYVRTLKEADGLSIDEVSSTDIAAEYVDRVRPDVSDEEFTRAVDMIVPHVNYYLNRP